MTLGDELRHVADVADQVAIGRRKELALRLLCRYMVRAMGEHENAAEAAVLHGFGSCGCVGKGRERSRSHASPPTCAAAAACLIGPVFSIVYP